MEFEETKPNNTNKLKIFFHRIQRHKLFFVYLAFALLTTILLLLLPNLFGKYIYNSKSKIYYPKPEEYYQTNEIVYEKAVEILEVSVSFNASQKNSITITNAVKKNGYLPSSLNKELDYKLLIYQDDSIAYTTNFSIPNKVIGAPPIPGSTEEEKSLILNQIDFILTTPYFKNISKIEIQDNLGKVVSSYTINNLETKSGNINVETKRGDVLSISSEIMSSFVNASTWFFSDVKAQNTEEYVDVTILGDDFSSLQMEDYKLDAQRMINHLLEYEPFKSRSSQFLFHIIENISDLGCSYSGRIIVCNNAQVMSIVNSAGVPSDVITVIINNNTYGGSAFYPINGNPGIAATYNGDLYGSEVFVHELGHAFGILADEYIASNSSEPNDKNCFSQDGMSSSTWQQLTGNDTYIPGCNYSSWFRSTQTSIMREIDQRFFNPISQYFLNQEIDFYAGKLITATTTPTLTPTTSNTPAPLDTNSPTPTTYMGDSITNTPTLTPTIISTLTPTSSVTLTSTPTTAPTNSPTPTTQLNCFQGISIALETSSHQVNPDDTINNNLLVTNNNDVGCGATAPLGISYSHPSVWTLTPSAFTVSVMAGDTESVPFSVYIKPEAETGTNIYQLWVASWGPVNGSVTVQ